MFLHRKNAKTPSETSEVIAVMALKLSPVPEQSRTRLGPTRRLIHWATGALSVVGDVLKGNTFLFLVVFRQKKEKKY